MDMTIDPQPTTSSPDNSINQADALTYWNTQPPTVNGMLGGYPHISRIDLQGSSNFLTKLRRGAQGSKRELGKLSRAADCGAGIGRITRGFLVNVAEKVDVVEPVVKFTSELEEALRKEKDEIKEEKDVGKEGDSKGQVGDVINLPLQSWDPPLNTYTLIWNQWCLGHLKDAQLVAYFRRCGDALSASTEEAWIVVKENMSTDALGQDIYDETDSSVTRTDEKFRRLFKEAGLRICMTEVQRGFPRDLFPVRMYALRPE